MFVAHGADVHTPSSLLVSLPVELLHYSFVPTSVQIQRFGWVTQIRTVHHVLKNLNVDQDDASSANDAANNVKQNTEAVFHYQDSLYPLGR